LVKRSIVNASGSAAMPNTTAWLMPKCRSFTSRKMLRQPLFWLMFAMMAMMSTSGLMVTSETAGGGSFSP
jgi:OFA family oxalate/formate antiporter-like MFS transporter